MCVVAFRDQYEAMAALSGKTAEELRQQDRNRGGPIRRWLAVDEMTVVGAITVRLRPDQRMFAAFAGRPDHYAVLAGTAATDLSSNLYATAKTEDIATVTALRGAGFTVEVETERFRVRFDAVLARLGHATLPTGFGLHPARVVDIERLFVLDNIIRNDVPGTDGWQGSREWFRDEISDPASYLVAINESRDEFAGLARIWRNPAGPRFGLVGVTRVYRNTPVGPALLRAVLTDAMGWGHPTFTAETSVTNRYIYPRLKRLGAESLGGDVQMVRSATG